MRGLRTVGRHSATYSCGICLETKKAVQTMYFVECKPKNHYTCKACMRTYIEDKIREGIVDIQCPYPKCASLASDRGIESCIHRSLASKRSRFKRMKEDSNYRECQKCGAEMKFNVKKKQMIKACTKCSAFACFVHGSAHEGKPCQEYSTDAEAASEATLQHYKKCPNCKAPVSKNGGCDHMVRC